MLNQIETVNQTISLSTRLSQSDSANGLPVIKYFTNNQFLRNFNQQSIDLVESQFDRSRSISSYNYWNQLNGGGNVRVGIRGSEDNGNSVRSSDNSNGNDSNSNWSSSSPPVGIDDPLIVSSVGGSDFWTFGEPDLRIHHPFLALLLGIICLLVMFGNILIMVAIRRERYLHTVTNLFVASLAVADCLVGAIVMPSSVVHEVMNKWWIFGQDWCDLWHSFDVLASTASILNLCVISLDRYWAITDPISYPARMTNRKAKILIALVWTCSALISFPAILWWRAVSSPPRPLRCDFTEDVGYLLFSSIISFYGPLIIMLVVYLRIYRAAIQQTKSIKCGTKSIAAIDGNENNAVVLRIHRGGGGNKSLNNNNNNTIINLYSPNEGQQFNPSINLSNQSSSSQSNHQRYPQLKSRLIGEVSFEDQSSDCTNSDNDTNSTNNNNNKVSSLSSSSARPPNMKSLSRKLAKLAKEKKAAKTLGIVMGVFILCWLPFFIANLVKGFCGDYCLINPDLVYPLVTWLGWLNSGMNPVIYACWSRDFRRAFKKILFLSWHRQQFSPENKISRLKSNRSNGKANKFHYKQSIGINFDKPKCPQNLIAMIDLTSASNDVSTL
ncbi:dopamine receptor 2-like [Panonychus citri]|uniref:dopamine receptor 2-like n=1 Tax=Panonychus citri TaxID=50023 RepID=UPI0023081F0B|nr:dopamine receptor 2-like [Panonychus citri]